MSPYETSWPELNYPSYRNDGLTVDKWIEGKRHDDGAEGLWRIRDSLYDLTDFLNSHPGGSMWLEITKGTDVSEAFASHHITDKAEKLLDKFYVREAKTPRNSPYTFHSNGFYETLKAKINRHFGNKTPGLTFQSRLMLDVAVVAALLCAVTASKYDSYYLATLAGFMFCMVLNCGHNFVHKKDTWRMYYFYLTSFSVRDFRISHCLSHHLYTNTIQDLEISLFEPLLQFLPQSNKSFVARYLSWIYFPYALSTISFGMIYKRIVTNAFTRNDFIMFVVPTLMLLGGSQTFVQTIMMWAWIVMFVGFFFGAIGFTAAHHHPTIFHEGDIPRNDRDWGLQQIDAVQDRVEIHCNVYVGLFVFGEHTMHHLFPTLDHPLLPQLYPAMKETLDEFGIKWKMNTIPDLIVGTFKQLSRIEKQKIKDE